MPVSERERSHMARLGQLKAESHAEAATAHLELPLAERLKRSWALFEAFRTTRPQVDFESEASAFFARARALGLYQQD